MVKKRIIPKTMAEALKTGFEVDSEEDSVFDERIEKGTIHLCKPDGAGEIYIDVPFRAVRTFGRPKFSATA